jgi:uncharacterized protein YggU (UPF0235/DUF167 family)
MSPWNVEPGTWNFLTEFDGGIRLTIYVQPRASRTELDGRHGDALKIRLAAAPVDGAANEALVRFLADTLARPRRSRWRESGSRRPPGGSALAGPWSRVSIVPGTIDFVVLCAYCSHVKQMLKRPCPRGAVAQPGEFLCWPLAVGGREEMNDLEFGSNGPVRM